jgi:TonB family protein
MPGPYDPPEGAAAISPAADVWSLGSTLVEALTQRPPVLDFGGRGEPSLPATIPQPLLDIASHCLRRDPQLRWTVADIAGRLQPKPPSRREQALPSPQSSSPNRRYVVPVLAVLLTLAAILGAAKFFTIRREPQPTPSLASELPKPQPKGEKRPAAPVTGKSAEKSTSEKHASSPAAALPASAEPKPAKKLPVSGLVPGEAYDQVLPDVPQKSSDTITGKVRVSVRVSVDSSGNVQDARLDSPGPSKYFANLALQAARRWSFSPAKVDGRSVASEWLLRFEFERTGAKVFPSEVAP